MALAARDKARPEHPSTSTSVSKLSSQPRILSCPSAPVHHCPQVGNSHGHQKVSAQLTTSPGEEKGGFQDPQHQQVLFQGPEHPPPELGMKQPLQPLSRSRQVSLSALERVVGVDRGFRLQPCGHTGQLTTASWPRVCIQASGLTVNQEGSEQQLSVLLAFLCAWDYPSALLRAS